MKKKTITTLATLAAATVILISSYISQNDSDKLTKDVTAKDSVTQSSVTQNSSLSATENSSKQSATPQSSTPSTNQPEKTTFPESIVKTQKKGIVPFGYITASVIKVTDGDTFSIKYDNKDYKVRMLDIDTPESVKSGVKLQPYAAESSDLTKETLTGKKVKLIFEKDTTDQYDRLLAHVILEDDTYYNAYMVQNGYAIAVFYSPNTLLKDYFSELQGKAIENEKGFWQLPENERPFIMDSKGKFVAAYKIKAKAA